MWMLVMPVNVLYIYRVQYIKNNIGILHSITSKGKQYGYFASVYIF